MMPNFVLGVKMTHNAKKSVSYVNQHPADIVAERLRGSINLDFHTKVLGVKRRLDGTGQFEPFCPVMEIGLVVSAASGPFRPQKPIDKTNGRTLGAYSGVMSNFKSFSTVNNLHVTVDCGMNGGVTTRNL
jgi:hypothetical protein